jgi:Family of unknown function (DUF6011)
VSKRPARVLPEDRSRRRGIKFYGEYVLWWDDGNWEWVKCVNCGRPLTALESRERGCGRSCAALVTDTAKKSILREEHAKAEAYREETRRPAVSRRRRPAKRAPIDTKGFTTTRLPDAPRSTGWRAATKPNGITNDQAKELARLQRAADETYTGSGMTEQQASAEIRRLKADHRARS